MKLENLKDDELEQSFHRAVASERKIMHSVVLHVQEVSRRKLHLVRGHGSLREYLVKKMKYSAPAAQRRIEAAKLLSDVPELSEKLETGAINLSQICEMHQAIGQAEKTHQEKITAEAKAAIIEKVAGQNVIETQQLCAEFFDLPVVAHDRVKTQRDFSKRLELTLSKEQFEKFEQVRDLLAHKNFQKKRTQSFADVLETAFETILEARDITTTRETETDFSGKRALTPRRKAFVRQRDGGCQFEDVTTGKICGSHFDLQVDHIQPRWAGGSNQPSNLRVLCRQHNLLREQECVRSKNVFDASRDHGESCGW
jgi:5-methylcytosine-specific restriction endonuclease McrA